MRGRFAVPVLGLVAAVAATAVGAVPTSAATSRPLPTKDPFYRYSGKAPLSRHAPGTVLKTRTVDVALSGSTTPVTATQLLYRTTNERGKPAVTVTTVLRPATAAASTEIVAYLSFYDALGSQCDPSYTLAGGDPGGSDNQQQADLEEGIIGQYLAEGLTVTVPDFEGTKLDWGAGQESGRTTIDAIRATENSLGVPRSTKVALSGYSGGSIAAEWASEIAARHARRLNIVGVAEGGIPVDFEHQLRYINGSQDWSGVIPAVLVSLTRAFGKHLPRYLSKKGHRIARQVHNECIGSFLGSYPGLTVASLVKHRYRHFLRIPTFVHIMNHLIMGSVGGHPRGPLLMGVGEADGTGDGVMITNDVRGLAHEYCKQGVPVEFQVYNNSDHDEAALHFEPAATEFIQERFAGTTFQGNCSSVGKGNSLKPIHLKRHHAKRHHAKRHATSRTVEGRHG